VFLSQDKAEKAHMKKKPEEDYLMNRKLIRPSLADIKDRITNQCRELLLFKADAEQDPDGGGSTRWRAVAWDH
jgi:hypothetical protein